MESVLLQVDVSAVYSTLSVWTAICTDSLLAISLQARVCVSFYVVFCQ